MRRLICTFGYRILQKNVVEASCVKDVHLYAMLTVQPIYVLLLLKHFAVGLVLLDINSTCLTEEITLSRKLVPQNVTLNV